VDKDRRYAIDAAIVRIMKARKMLAHSELIDEVLSQLAVFRPRQKAIKQRIEHLIEREYLKRSDKSPNVYVVSAVCSPFALSPRRLTPPSPLPFPTVHPVSKMCRCEYCAKSLYS
jgi:hypothetical protein